MNRITKWINLLLPYFIILFLFGYIGYGTSSPKYLGLFFILLSIVFLVLTEFKTIEKQLVTTLSHDKWLWIMVVITLLEITTSTAINFYPGLRLMGSYLGPVLLIVVVLLSLSLDQKRNLLKMLMALMVIVLVYNLIRYSWQSYKYYDLYHRFDRNASTFMVLLFPFLMTYISYQKGKKPIIAMLCLVASIPLLIALLWTGSRGAWGAIVVELVLFVSLENVMTKYKPKNLIIVFSIIMFVLIASGTILYHTNQIVKNQVDRGLSTNGRTEIVATRFPLFFDSHKTVLGFGYSDQAYNHFFRGQNAPQIYGYKKLGKFYYFQDGPYVLQVFYHFGYLGLICYISLISYFILRTYKLYKNTNDEYVKKFLLAILLSFIGYYLIRGLFEGRSLTYLFLLVGLYSLASATLSERNNINNKQAINNP